MKDALGHGSESHGGGDQGPWSIGGELNMRMVPKPGHEAAYAAERADFAARADKAARDAFSSVSPAAAAALSKSHDDTTHTGAEHVAALGDAHGLPMEHGQGGAPQGTSNRGRFGSIWAGRLNKGS